MQKTHKGTLLIVILSAMLIAGLYIGYYFAIPSIVWDKEWRAQSVGPSVENAGVRIEAPNDDAEMRPWNKCGVFGDSFGALTCLFSALAFWGAILTLCMQYNQMKDNSENIAIEHLPIVVQVPKRGTMFFGVTKKGRPVLNLRFEVEECNTSADTALHVAHKVGVVLEKPKTRRWYRRINFMNNLQSNKPVTRKDKIVLFDQNEVDAFLRALISSDEKERPIAECSVAYKNFYNFFAWCKESYRVKLAARDQYVAAIGELLNFFAAGSKVSMPEILKRIGEDNAVELIMANIRDRSCVESIHASKYEEFCKG